MRFLLYIFLISPLLVLAQTPEEKVTEIRTYLHQTPKRALAEVDAARSKLTLNHQQALEFQILVVVAHTNLANLDDAQAALDALNAMVSDETPKSYLARFLSLQAEIHYIRSEYADAEKLYWRVHPLYRELEDTLRLAQNWLRLSSAARKQGRYEEAIEYANNALPDLQEIGDLRSLSSYYNGFGLAHYMMGNHTQALEAQKSQLAILAELNDENGMSDSLYNIASSLLEIGDYVQAKEYLSRSLKIDSQAGFKDNIAYDHVQLSLVELKLGNITSAREHGKQAARLFKETKAERDLGWALISQGRVESAVEQYALADQYLQEGLALAVAADDKRLIARGHIELATIAQRSQRYQDSTQLVDAVLDGAYERNDAEQIEELLALKINALEQLEEFAEALSTFKALQTFNQQRSQQVREETIARLQHDIDSRAKAHEIKLLEKDNLIAQAEIAKSDLERNTWLAGTMVLILLAAIFAFREREKGNLARLQQKYLNEAAIRKDELLADVSHELRTPLTVLKLHIESLEYDIVDDPKETYLKLNTKIAELNKLIEDIYQLTQSDNGALIMEFESHSPLVLLDGIVKQYQSMVESVGLTFTLDLDLDDREILLDSQRITQAVANLITNSVAYTDAPGLLHLSSHFTATHWHFSIFDSSPAVDDEDWECLFERLYRCDKSRSRNTGGSGLGLAITKSLIESHDGTIVAQPSEYGGVHIEFSVPLKSEEKQVVEKSIEQDLNVPGFGLLQYLAKLKP